MFNTRLKDTIAAQAAELAELRQLREGLQREMLTLSIDTAVILLASNAQFAQALGYRPDE